MFFWQKLVKGNEGKRQRDVTSAKPQAQLTLFLAAVESLLFQFDRTLSVMIKPQAAVINYSCFLCSIWNLPCRRQWHLGRGVMNIKIYILYINVGILPGISNT
jgi:hypothetical protein